LQIASLFLSPGGISLSEKFAINSRFLLVALQR
jgi:hypothetical protein